MKKAFTLAEVLITLGIIGVVAALTLPPLVQNYQKRSLEVATQKFYSVMSQAIKQYMADEGVDDLREGSLSVDEGAEDYDEKIEVQSDEFFKKYLKAQICEGGCFADSYKTQTGETSYAIGKSADYHIKGRYLLPDGMVVDSVGWGALGTDIQPGYIYVDINGRKGPNKIGYDLWGMTIFYDGIIDESELTPECRKNNECLYGHENAKEIRDNRFIDCKDNVNYIGNYGGCFGHFLENGFKFDY